VHASAQDRIGVADLGVGKLGQGEMRLHAEIRGRDTCGRD
jgi:hypothetical protein